MSRQDANVKRAGSFESPSTRRGPGALLDHPCRVCGRWASFGVSEGGRNDHHDWYCRDHLVEDDLSEEGKTFVRRCNAAFPDTVGGGMAKTFVRRFEEVFLSLKADGGSRPTKKEITPEG